MNGVVAISLSTEDRNRLLSEICEALSVPLAQLLAPSRCKAEIAFKRQIAMYVTHVTVGLSFTQVGKIFGRDRCTVRAAAGVVEDKRDDVLFDGKVAALEQQVRVLGLRPVAAGIRAEGARR